MSVTYLVLAWTRTVCRSVLSSHCAPGAPTPPSHSAAT